MLSPFENPEISSALTSDDDHAALVTFRLRPDADEINAETFYAAVKDNKHIQIKFLGNQLINDEVARIVLEDVATAEAGTLPIVLFFVVITFQGCFILFYFIYFKKKLHRKI